MTLGTWDEWLRLLAKVGSLMFMWFVFWPSMRKGRNEREQDRKDRD